MARIRYLKPDFFLDDQLAELPFEARLGFQGLWCHADRDGKLEDNIKKLKVLIFPYDKVEMDKILNLLTKKPFIHRYQVDGKRYIRILNFQKHQKPHHTERKSEIPDITDENQILTVKEPLKDGEKPEGMGKGMGNGKGNGECTTAPSQEFTVFTDLVFNKWNKFCEAYPVFPKVGEITESRREKLRVRYQKQSFKDFVKILKMVETQMRFLSGDNEKKWVMSFDWLIENDTNYIKVLEGKYKDRNNFELTKNFKN